MEIILLSGGSGKRLWPLSNHTRSKQFLPFFKSPSGEFESMLQRVVRQIDGSGIKANITVATNSTQKDIIINQLGNGVNVVTEPERRDTFPAIALASCYLSMFKHCKDDETVIIMPCDPCTEDGYFKTVGRMAEAVSNNVAELVLMGIQPTYPSSKFGYIVPEGEALEGGIRSVRYFTEKPDKATAEKLISNGAMWNGGVFAFRLGYLMDIVRKYTDADSFEKVRAEFTAFPKISFDYEVAEKAKSVAVVPFSGKWKDMGTWNAFSEELPEQCFGNVRFGENNVNTHAINELGIPLFCAGLKDVIVASGPEGILVSSKDESEKIKSYVDELIGRPMYEERRWGIYRVIDNSTYGDGFKSLTKSIIVKAGKHISYQVHKHRDEVWSFVDGEGTLILDGEVRKVGRGDVIHIKKGQHHAVQADTDLSFIEVQMGDLLVEEDIERFDWPL